MPSAQQDEFLKRLRMLAAKNQLTKDSEMTFGIPHAELAKALGVKLSAVERWLYRDCPSEWVVAALKTKMDLLWDEYS